MNAKEFLENFGHLADAPYGISKLRQTILQLAVQGKLVEQDPNDEPASELMRKIQSRRAANHVSIGKKTKDFKSAEKTDRVMPLPAGWAVSCLGNILDVRDGTHDSPKYVAKGFPLITSKNLSSGSLCFDNIKMISEADHRKIEKRSKVDKNDILLAMIGSIGNPVIVDTDKEFSIKNVALIKPYSQELSNQRYLLYWLKEATGRFTTSSAGGVQRFVSLTFLRNQLFTLPPLAEQKRIVAKVDELMALCDDLESKQQERRAVHVRVNTAALDSLSTAGTDTEFDDAWSRVRSNFNLLYSVPDNVKALRQTILQLAVQGKLVEQDPNDEPASELMRKIQSRRAANHVSIGKKTKDFKSAEKTDRVMPLPAGWAVSCLGNILDVRDGTHDSPKYVAKGFPLITSKNLSSGSLCFDNIKMISEADHRKIEKRSKVDKNDILLAMIGSIGNPVIVDTDKEFSIKNVALIKPYSQELSNQRYLLYWLKEATGRFTTSSAGGVQRFVSLTFLRNQLFTLPPLAEQKRIVAKVDELMTLCDDLETKLTQQQGDANRLTEAMVAAVLGNAAA